MDRPLYTKATINRNKTKKKGKPSSNKNPNGKDEGVK